MSQTAAPAKRKRKESAPPSAPLPEYRITPGAWLRMMKTLDVLTGNRVARTLRAAARILGILLVLYIIFLAVLVIAPGSLSAADADKGPLLLLLESSHRKAEDVLSFLLNLFTVTFTGVTALQIYLMKDINHQEMSHQVFQDNQDYRRDSGNAKHQLKELAEDPDLQKSFNTAYVKGCYSNLRAYAFHYEYIGQLVYRNRLNFGITFDTITFPNWLITSEDAETVISAGRTAFSDFWLGVYHLYLTYEVRRKYNSLYFARRERHRDKETVAACRKAFRTACRMWKRHYRTMPPI